MKITSVICEYNPFHFGHEYQLSEIKKHSAVICIMSGSFTQRGSPAILSKYERARLAVMHGADLVLELPFPFSSARADLFARGGIQILSSLGCVDEICFGSESGDLQTLLKTEERLRSSVFQAALAECLQKDPTLSHQAAKQTVFSSLYGKHTMPNGSNDLLALSYLTALHEIGSFIVPVTLKRMGETYNGSGQGFSSATSIRTYLKTDNIDALKISVPPMVADSLVSAKNKGELCNEDALYPFFAFLVRTREDMLNEIPDIPEDLLFRMKKAGKSAKNMEEFLSLTSSKCYSPSRIRRGVLFSLLHVREIDFQSLPYTMVLAANETGREILSSIRKTANIAVITKPGDAKNFGDSVFSAFSCNAQADRIWSLLLSSPLPGDTMMKEHPRMVNGL